MLCNIQVVLSWPFPLKQFKWTSICLSCIGRPIPTCTFTVRRLLNLPWMQRHRVLHLFMQSTSPFSFTYTGENNLLPFLVSFLANLPAWRTYTSKVFFGTFFIWYEHSPQAESRYYRWYASRCMRYVTFAYARQRVGGGIKMKGNSKSEKNDYFLCFENTRCFGDLILSCLKITRNFFKMKSFLIHVFSFWGLYARRQP